MKKTRRIIGVLLAFVMLCMASPIVMPTSIAAPSGGAVVFVKKGGNGSGVAANAAVGSLSTAINSVANAGGGTVVLVGPIELTSNVAVGVDNGCTIKLTSVYDGVDYRTEENGNAAIVFTKPWINISSRCAFEYENITLRMNGSNCSFYANGYPITFGKGVKTDFVAGFDSSADRVYPNIYGGSAFDLSATKNFPANTSVTVLSGSFWSIIGGGKGTGENPRPSLSATLTIGKDVVVKGNCRFAQDSNGVIEGEKIYVALGGENPSAKKVIDEATKKIVSSDENGYIQGTAPGVYNIWAESGYGASIGDTVIPNGEYKNDDTFEVTFVKSDINKAAELAALRPALPTAFPGEYIKGYDNGDGTMSFRPSGNITIAESATVVTRLMTSEDKIKGKYETEKASKDAWFYDTVAYLDTFGAFDSFDNFDPARNITRAEFIALISTFKNLGAKTNEITFTDVAETHKYYDAIKAGTMSKIVNGYDNGDGTFSFRPDNSITRAEVVTVINRIFDMADLAPIKYKQLVPNFSDVEPSHWAAYQIVAAAGGKEKEPEKIEISGTGEVEFEIDGKVMFVRDDAPDGGDGSSYEKAVKWNAVTSSITESGTIVICGPVEFNSNFRFTSGHTGTVMVTSVYGGVDYRAEKNAAIIFGSDWKNGIANGDMIFDNLAIISKGQNCSIYCDNHRVEFGKDVVCVLEQGSYVGIYGGAANDLSATRNYIGSTDTTSAHTGEYHANIIIGGGSWGNVTAGGKGTADKKRESDAGVISVAAGAKVGSISAGSKEGNAKVHGMRVIILNGYEISSAIEEDKYDYIVNVIGKASAEAIKVSKDSVTLKITAENGKPVEGTEADGTMVLTGEGSVIVTADENGARAVKNSKNSVNDSLSVNVEYVSADYLAELDALEAKRKAEILSTKTEITLKEGATAYYISTSGDDSNDGLSPDKPWKTIGKLNSTTFKSGDVVYFKRGDEWRNVSLSAKAGVTYTAYGEGAKPVLNRSPFDGAKHGSWTLVEGTENIYVYSEKFVNDIGTIAFNDRTFTDIYAQKICFSYDKDKKPVSGGKAIENPLAELKNDLDFWHDLKGPNVTYSAGGELYLRSNSGNPAERFSNIEFNQRGNAVSIAGSGVTIDNLNIRHAGSHGVGSGTTSNLTVTNCAFEWIGGSMQNYNNGFVRFGNAVEIYGGCDGYLVDNCYINQVYDAGVTHQVTQETDGDMIMKNVTYSNNVILNCIYSIEHFNRAKAGTTRYLVNILYKDNLCRYAGYGFGNTRPNKGSASHIRSGTLVDTANFVIEGNVFDRSLDVLFLFSAGGDEEIQWKNNVYIHRFGARYGTLKGNTVPYNDRIEEVANGYFKTAEIGGKYYFVEK